MIIDGARVIALVVVAAISLGAGWSVRGWKEGSDTAIRLEAQQAQEALARSVVSKIAETTGEAIAGIKVTNTTIYQRTRQEIIREPMDPACRLPAGWMRNINAARADRPVTDAALPETAGGASGR